MSRCWAAGGRPSSPTAGASCSTAPGQGRIDVFFLSGGQIDGDGNINLVSIGDYEHPKVRFPGSFGSSYHVLRRAQGDPVPPRAHPPHAGRQSRFHQRAGNAARTTSIARAVRSRSSPTAACSPSTARAVASGWRACIPGTRVAEVDREHRFRLRSAGAGAGDGGPLPRDAAPAAHGDRAAPHRGLSAICRRRVRCNKPSTTTSLNN